MKMSRVTRYDGTFELAFLHDNEKVRGYKDKSIEIIDAKGGISARANVEDILVRKGDGAIHVIREIADITYEDIMPTKADETNDNT